MTDGLLEYLFDLVVSLDRTLKDLPANEREKLLVKLARQADFVRLDTANFGGNGREVRAMIAEVSIQIKAIFEVKKVLKDGWRVWYTPNGEFCDDPRKLSKLMALGLLPGVPDIVAVSPGGRLHFMEFKSATGTLSDAQQAFQLWAIRASIPHSVVRSVDEAMKVFRHWGCTKELAAHDAQP